MNAPAVDLGVVPEEAKPDERPLADLPFEGWCREGYWQNCQLLDGKNGDPIGGENPLVVYKLRRP